MAGANVAMITSALLQHGTAHVKTILGDLEKWMEEHESIQQMRSSMSAKSVAQPVAFERANYMRVLRSYEPKVM